MLLFIIHCLLLLTLFVVVCVCAVRYVLLSFEKRACCYTFIVILVSGGCGCSSPLPHSAMDWSAVYDCGIGWSYALTFCHNDTLE